MNKIAIKLIFAALILVVVPLDASAAAVLRTGENISVTNDQVVNGDFYATGGTVSNSGLIEGDVYSAAGSFTSNGVITEDLTVISGSVQVHASVTDDVRVIGGDIVVAGDVGGDVVVVGGLLKILSTANIKGDVLFFGGELQVLGNVDGSVMGTAEQARIDALIGKSVDMKVGTLTLGDNAEILGDVRYTSIGEIVRSQNAVVVGEIVKNTAPVEKEVSYEMYVVSFIVILFSALILQLLFRTQLLKSIPALTHNLGAAGLVGMASLILIPIVVVISLASMLGMLVGLIMLFAFILLILISCALSSILVGVILQKYINGTESLNVAYTIFGAVILQISLVIPVLGFIVVTLIFLITFGTLIRSLYFAATA